tara:strand:+ start:112 stop:603 length:492 start_codon:yes stop_codon:yes gene_type:complete
MPQLNPEFFVSQLFWLVITFSFLFIFLWRVSLPRISTVLEKRQNKIDENLSSARELQEQSQEIEKKINEQISTAKQETEDTIKKTILSLQDNVFDQLSILDNELEEKILNSEKEIIKNKDEQMKNIDEEIINITKITVSKISDLAVSNSDINNSLKIQRKGIN